MEISVYLKDYVEKLKKDKLKPFYNKKNNNFEIDNIYDYLEIIDILQNEKEKDRNAVFKEFYYRGVSNSEWELLPSLAVNDLEFYEPVMIEEFKKAYPSEFDVKDDFEIIAKMQHYGLPTRLLDFTSNPLVSLYFSCSDIQQKEKDGKVIVALPRKNLYDGLDEYRDLIYKAHDQSFLLSWLEENPGNLYTYLGMVYVPNSLFFKTPSYITEREKRQSSVFMLFANSIVDVEKDTCISDEEAAYIILEGEEYYKKHYGSEKSIFKLHPTLKRLSKQQYQMNFTEVIIPKKVKKDILRQLSNIGISKNYLFPEMEYTAEYIKNKYIFGTQRLINGNFDADYEL